MAANLVDLISLQQRNLQQVNDALLAMKNNEINNFLISKLNESVKFLSDELEEDPSKVFSQIDIVISNCSNGNMQNLVKFIDNFIASPKHMDFTMICLSIIASSDRVAIERKLNLLYIINDLIYHFNRVEEGKALLQLEQNLPLFLHHLLLVSHKDENQISKIDDILKIWGEKQLLSPPCLSIISNKANIASFYNGMNQRNFGQELQSIAQRYDFQIQDNILKHNQYVHQLQQQQQQQIHIQNQQKPLLPHEMRLVQSQQQQQMNNSTDTTHNAHNFANNAVAHQESYFPNPVHGSIENSGQGDLQLQQANDNAIQKSQPPIDLEKNYHIMPAGLIVPLFAERISKANSSSASNSHHINETESKKVQNQQSYRYQPIDPKNLEIPKSLEADAKITALINEFYGNMEKCFENNKMGFDTSMPLYPQSTEHDSAISEEDSQQEQPIPKVIEECRKYVEDVQSRKKSKYKSKREQIDQMNVKFLMPNDQSDSDSEIDTDYLFDFNSSEEEQREFELHNETTKVISTVSKSLSKHHTNYLSKVEMAKMKAQQAQKSITPIESDNIGHKLLQKMGWSQGKRLGINDNGLLEPIKASRESEAAAQSSDIFDQATNQNKNAGLGVNNNRNTVESDFLAQGQDSGENSGGNLENSNGSNYQDFSQSIQNFRELNKMKRNQMYDLKRARQSLRRQTNEFDKK